MVKCNTSQLIGLRKRETRWLSQVEEDAILGKQVFGNKTDGNHKQRRQRGSGSHQTPV